MRCDQRSVQNTVQAAGGSRQKAIFKDKEKTI